MKPKSREVGPAAGVDGGPRRPEGRASARLPSLRAASRAADLAHHDARTGDAAAKVSLTARGDKSTGWAMAWRINFWARLLDGDHAYTLLRNLLHITGKGNSIDYGKGRRRVLQPVRRAPAVPDRRQLRRYGRDRRDAAAIARPGEIHLLPALPKAWPDGSVTGLRARGNLTVDITWKGGRLVRASIRSTIANRATVRYGEKTRKIEIKANVPVTVEM